ncbi:hypothetical protein V8F33_007601 [Rhypophila sp. PSN 637]
MGQDFDMPRYSGAVEISSEIKGLCSLFAALLPASGETVSSLSTPLLCGEAKGYLSTRARERGKQLRGKVPRRMLLHVSFLVIPSCSYLVVYFRMDGWNSTPSDEGVDGVREGDGDSETESHSLIEVHHVDSMVNSVCGSSVVTCLRSFLSAPPAGERLDNPAWSDLIPVMVATTTDDDDMA